MAEAMQEQEQEELTEVELPETDEDQSEEVEELSEEEAKQEEPKKTKNPKTFWRIGNHWHILAIARAPVRRASALILCLHNPLMHRKEAMAKSIGQERPDTPHQIHHMQSHQIGTGKHTANIMLQKIRPWKCPLCRCNCNKQIWKRAQPYLPRT